MESYIRVKSTPNIMGKALRDETPNIRLMEAIDFVDPEPELNDEDWAKKYGDMELIYKVIIRHPETKNHLNEYHLYSSWGAVKGALQRKINAYKEV